MNLEKHMKIAILDDCSADIRFLETLILESNIDNVTNFDDNCPAKAEFYEFAAGETLLAEYGMDGLQSSCFL